MTSRPWSRPYLGGIAARIGSWFRRPKEGQSSTSRLQQQQEAARALVAVYFRLLQENTGVLIPGSRLVADKDVFKAALKIAATTDMVAGRLDDVNGKVKRRDAYILGYARLADFVPDDVAERINRFHDSIRRARDLVDVDGRTLAKAIDRPGAGDLDQQAETAAEYGRLAAEFKAFLEAAEAARQRSAATSGGRLSDLEEVFPRWKLCILLFVGLTIATVFVPNEIGWTVFSLTSGFICWRGYRDFGLPALFEVIRIGVIGAFIGTLLWGGLAAPLQRNGLIRLSRDIQISAPEWFLCCLWSGKSPQRDR